MAATPYSNVINLQPGGPSVSPMANRILLECRDLAARRLREALREMLQKIGEGLLEQADRTTDGNERRTLLRLRDGLNEKAGRLEGLLAAHWGSEFDASLKGGRSSSFGKALLEDMQIVDYGEMDEELALKSLARRLASKCESELYGLGRRFSHLAGKDKEPDAENPAAPEVLTRALQSALKDADFDTPTRLELCRKLEELVEMHVSPIYRALNAQLLQHNILPDLRRDYGRAPHAAGKNAALASAGGDMFAVLQRLVSGAAAAPAGTAAPGIGLPAGGQSPAPSAGSGGPMQALAGEAARSVPPPHVWASLEALQRTVPDAALPQASTGSGADANILYHFRASEIGQGLGQLDAITVDIVAMLFDMIFDDREISDPIKALVGKLQIPVLKVAMLDRGFFSSKAHPTRRLLDVISRTALRWGQQVERDDPIYNKIAEVIDHIHNNFKQDTALFATLCDDLEQFLATQENAASGNIKRAAMLIVQRELDELADMMVQSELQRWLETPLPNAITDLLEHEWRRLLKRIHREDGPASPTWESALGTAGVLVESIRPRNDAQGRQALARELPVLIKQLSVGFDRLGVEAERRRTLLDALFSLHAAALRGNEPALPAATETAPAASEPDIASQALGDGEVTVESISVISPISATLASQDVADLQRGDWVEYIQPDGEAKRYRLSWISPQRGIFLFTNPQSPHAVAVSPEAMSLQLQRGEVRIVPTEPIFDRALTRTIDVLQAA